MPRVLAAFAGFCPTVRPLGPLPRFRAAFSFVLFFCRRAPPTVGVLAHCGAPAERWVGHALHSLPRRVAYPRDRRRYPPNLRGLFQNSDIWAEFYVYPDPV